MFSKSYCLDDSRRHLENHWFSAALVGVKKAYRRFDPRAFNRDFGIASGILFAKPKFFFGLQQPLTSENIRSALAGYVEEEGDKYKSEYRQIIVDAAVEVYGQAAGSSPA
ncbi:MAG: hypothetical protein KDI46_02425 [Alphaproteobacteria bacterium]|nr:hypothetical protein [Alphaproteobacteria bacterium]